MLNALPSSFSSASSSAFYNLKLPNSTSKGPGMPQTQMITLRTFGAATLLEKMFKRKRLCLEKFPHGASKNPFFPTNLLSFLGILNLLSM